VADYYNYLTNYKRKFSDFDTRESVAKKCKKRLGYIHKDRQERFKKPSE